MQQVVAASVRSGPVVVQVRARHAQYAERTFALVHAAILALGRDGAQRQAEIFVRYFTLPVFPSLTQYVC